MSVIQYSSVVYVIKIESVSEITIFYIKMMVKSGLEIFILAKKTSLLCCKGMEGFQNKNCYRPLFKIILRSKIVILDTNSIWTMETTDE